MAAITLVRSTIPMATATPLARTEVQAAPNSIDAATLRSALPPMAAGSAPAATSSAPVAAPGDVAAMFETNVPALVVSANSLPPDEMVDPDLDFMVKIQDTIVTLMGQGYTLEDAVLEVGAVLVDSGYGIDEATYLIQGAMLVGTDDAGAYGVPPPAVQPMVEDVAELVLNADLPGASKQMQEYLVRIASEGLPVDPMAFVQWVLREAYLENTNDLLYYAEKVRFFNEAKKDIRDELARANQMMGRYAGSEDDAPVDAFSPQQFETNFSGGEYVALGRYGDAGDAYGDPSMPAAPVDPEVDMLRAELERVNALVAQDSGAGPADAPRNFETNFSGGESVALPEAFSPHNFDVAGRHPVSPDDLVAPVGSARAAWRQQAISATATDPDLATGQMLEHLKASVAMLTSTEAKRLLAYFRHPGMTIHLPWATPPLKTFRAGAGQDLGAFVAGVEKQLVTARVRGHQAVSLPNTSAPGSKDATAKLEGATSTEKLTCSVDLPLFEDIQDPSTRNSVVRWLNSNIGAVFNPPTPEAVYAFTSDIVAQLMSVPDAALDDVMASLQKSGITLSWSGPNGQPATLPFKPKAGESLTRFADRMAQDLLKLSPNSLLAVSAAIPAIEYGDASKPNGTVVQLHGIQSATPPFGTPNAKAGWTTPFSSVQESIAPGVVARGMVRDLRAKLGQLPPAALAAWLKSSAPFVVRLTSDGLLGDESKQVQLVPSHSESLDDFLSALQDSIEKKISAQYPMSSFGPNTWKAQAQLAEFPFFDPSIPLGHTNQVRAGAELAHSLGAMSKRQMDAMMRALENQPRPAAEFATSFSAERTEASTHIAAKELYYTHNFRDKDFAEIETDWQTKIDAFAQRCVTWFEGLEPAAQQALWQELQSKGLTVQAMGIDVEDGQDKEYGEGFFKKAFANHTKYGLGEFSDVDADDGVRGYGGNDDLCGTERQKRTADGYPDFATFIKDVFTEHADSLKALLQDEDDFGRVGFYLKMPKYTVASVPGEANADQPTGTAAGAASTGSSTGSSGDAAATAASQGATAEAETEAAAPSVPVITGTQRQNLEIDYSDDVKGAFEAIAGGLAGGAATGAAIGGYVGAIGGAIAGFVAGLGGFITGLFDNGSPDDYTLFSTHAKLFAAQLYQQAGITTPEQEALVLDFFRNNGGFKMRFEIHDSDGNDEQYTKEFSVEPQAFESLDAFLLRAAEEMAEQMISYVRDDGDGQMDEGAINIDAITTSSNFPTLELLTSEQAGELAGTPGYYFGQGGSGVGGEEGEGPSGTYSGFEPDSVVSTYGDLEAYVKDLEEKLGSVGEDAQLANTDLQNNLQKQQQTLQTMSNISKMLHDTAMSIIRNMAG